MRLSCAAMRRLLLWSALVPLGIWLGVAPALHGQAPVSVTTSVSGGVASVPGAPAYHPSRVLVRFRNGMPAVFLPGSGTPLPFPLYPNLFLVPIPPGLAVADAVQRYQSIPAVLYAEPDFVVNAVVTPNDTMWSQQWDMVKIAAPAAWDSQSANAGDANDVVVAIIDTGINFTHEDLCAKPAADGIHCLQPLPGIPGNIWVNPTDGSNGFTCMNGSCVAGGLDDYGHGTHVAGTIGAVGNNSLGIAGLNWKIQMLSLKFLNSGGSGFTSDAVLCFQKALELKQQGVNIRLTSNSWGGGGFSQALKDAMQAGEDAGIVDVCAAGNSGQNADAFPMYPAGYDNRGIISVLATDSNDLGAGFTNYGLANVDIGAPGVSTLSTVPKTTCSLCDPSGYKLLSGTSMATPHVSGVLASLFHQQPALTTSKARDVILDPLSYDPLTDARAQSSSTGGRLNFNKVLNNTASLTSPLNNFPTVTMGGDVFAAPGSQVSLTATGSDLDGDTLRKAWVKSANTGSLWLFGWMLGQLFPSPPSSADTFTFTAPSPARTAIVSYDASVADGRGGGAHARQYVTVSPASNPGQPPSGTLSTSVTGPDAQGNYTVAVNFGVTDPEGSTTAWDFWVGQKNGASGTCCFTGSATSFQAAAGVYRVSVQAIDRELNLSTRQSAALNLGGATGTPPIISATVNPLSGQVPLTVNVDLGGSSDPDGSVVSYYISCGNGTSTGGGTKTGTCVYTQPGAYWLMLQVQDNSNNVDIMSAYVVATPVSGGDTTPPTVSMTSPANGAAVSGSVTVSANATDASGIKQVDFYRNTDANKIGTATSSPYSITWDSTTVVAGSHTLYAKATDNAGNIGTSASVSITVDNTAPTVSMTSPADGATVSGNVTVSATASDASGSGVKQVEFFLDSSTSIGKATSSPYSITWNSGTTSAGPHTLKAVATDNAGNTTTSSTVSITVAASLVVSITLTPAPTNGTVPRKSIETITATVTNGAAPYTVDFIVNSSVVCTGTVTTCAWEVPAAANKTYTISANATDANGLKGNSNTITVTGN